MGPVEDCPAEEPAGVEAVLAADPAAADGSEHDEEMAAKTAIMTRVSERVRMVLSVVMRMLAVL